MSDRIEQVLRIAATQVNVTECPPNSNAGLKVEEYLAMVGLTKGQPWCAAWVAWVGVTALGKAAWKVPLTGGCMALGNWARGKKILETAPVRGSIFLRWMQVKGVWRFAHTGFVIEAAAAGKWNTLEGNTSGAGSREGWGVFAQQRTWGPEDRFIVWDTLYQGE